MTLAFSPGGRGREKPVTRRIAVVFGTRPEAIKLAPLIRKMQQVPGLACQVCVTAQHRELLDDVLREFTIQPSADLDLMRPNQTPESFASDAIAALGEFLGRAQPHLLVVQGDTSSALCAALAAFYGRIPVGHVEAGLRSGNLDAPWPEEMNRRLISRLSNLHFAPTDVGRNNLLAEGIPANRIFVTGNTVVDALYHTLERVRSRPPAPPAGLPGALLDRDSPQRLVLVTSHRREHLPRDTESIYEAARRLADRYRDVAFVCPVHPNPEVRRVTERVLASPSAENLFRIDPLPYSRFVALMERATLILTDSGGIQEEAPSLGKPVLILRASTERPEAVEAGSALLVGTDPEGICAATARLLENRAAYDEMAVARHPFGEPGAAQRIVKVLRRELGLG